jgi:peptidylprolyl isomerase
MKKIIYLMLVTGFVLTFSACSSAGPSAKNVPAPRNNAQSSSDLQLPAGSGQASGQDNDNQTNSQANMSTNQTNPNIPTDLAGKFPFALIKTSLGDIKVKLDPQSAPLASNNFLNLAKTGFYDGTKFHRVIKGFMIQGGDPKSKDESLKDEWGTGGPGYQFPDELTGKEIYPQGTLAMANSGPNTNGSQFFIVTASPAAPLPPSYTVFGSVVSGMDVALKIESVPTTGDNGNPANQPLTDVVINTIEPLEQ